MLNISLKMSESERLSRFLGKILRHEATNRGLTVSHDGYVDVDSILDLCEVNDFNEEDVKKVVAKDGKGRFKLRGNGKTDRLQIKATQGHSLKLPDTSADLIPIGHYTEARVVLHGTQANKWESIKSSGLSRMRRNHIHFAQGETGQKSGFPPYCNMAIEIDLKKALNDGIKFYKSENDVILSPGNSSGCIPKKYFKRAYYIATRQAIPLD